MRLGDGMDAIRLAKILGYRSVELPIKYLGLLLGAKYKCMATWDSVMVRFEKRLVRWKKDILSKEVRLILIKSMMANIPHLLYVPIDFHTGVVKRLKKVERRFLWGDMEDKKSIIL